MERYGDFEMVNGACLNDAQDEIEALKVLLEKLTLMAFEEGYSKAEDNTNRGDGAWEYSYTKERLEKILNKEWISLEW